MNERKEVRAWEGIPGLLREMIDAKIAQENYYAARNVAEVLAMIKQYREEKYERENT